MHQLCVVQGVNPVPGQLMHRLGCVLDVLPVRPLPMSGRSAHLLVRIRLASRTPAGVIKKIARTQL